MISQDAIYAAALQLFQVKFMTDELEPTPGWRNGGRMKAWEECVAVALDFANSMPGRSYVPGITWDFFPHDKGNQP